MYVRFLRTGGSDVWVQRLGSHSRSFFSREAVVHEPPLTNASDAETCRNNARPIMFALKALALLGPRCWRAESVARVVILLARILVGSFYDSRANYRVNTLLLSVGCTYCNNWPWKA